MDPTSQVRLPESGRHFSEQPPGTASLFLILRLLDNRRLLDEFVSWYDAWIPITLNGTFSRFLTMSQRMTKDKMTPARDER